MKLKIFFITFLAISCVLSVVAVGFFTTLKNQELAVAAPVEIPVAPAAASASVPVAASPVSVVIEVPRMASVTQPITAAAPPVRKFRNIKISNGDPCECEDIEPKPTYHRRSKQYYSRPVGVETSDHRNAQIRAAQARYRALLDESSRLGSAKFEKILLDVNQTEIARLQSGNAFASR